MVDQSEFIDTIVNSYLELIVHKYYLINCITDVEKMLLREHCAN